MDRDELLNHLSDLLSQLTRDLHTSPASEWPDQELTHPQFRTLTWLRRQPSRMSDIAAHLGIGLSSATSMVDRLEKKGLVRRWHETDDRRVVVCELTAAGEQAIDQMFRVGNAGMERLVSVLSDDELDQVVRAVGLLVTAAQRHREAGDGR